MALHRLSDASEMNLHDLPADLELQFSPTEMNRPLGAVSAADNDEQTVEDSQETVLPLDDRLQTLYNTYHTSYTCPITAQSAHMQHARDLAFALLQRHYPASQQYRVEASALGPLTKYGLNFELKTDGEPDSDTDMPRTKRPKYANKKEKAVHSEPAWHSILPENIAAFAVKKGTVEVNEGVETLVWRAYTNLVILLDDMSTFPRWSRENLNHRGDALADLPGIIGGMQRGHGILFFGPRLEMYSYDANDAYKPVKPYANPDWRMDMRTTSLAEVDIVLRSFIRQEPIYMDGY
ncbi:uncharacterized protein M421DRAFT_205658 [Didymella exigua CBS 183.55]|uniref:Uncharacterized protein n=1 Tax=Didymella exigua CBS 183.55 TaxID=1150837 RepID=A0A6A5RI10_9PLEO|nr:uncharacterized protein M421DRAFT_205658 [Didymella exigua CBS 183.55]KAF1926734.1 hypothetical protein M421DRAFT_205658 [Didymella exigua CBS 183.55]